jgi:cytochrome c oxidase assembly protein subunit 15
MLSTLFTRFAWISLVFVHLVIIAGSVVRMTGSGMGCPDWPKCFGYTIPPTSTEEVTWHPERAFKKGQMIVHEVSFEGVPQERLLVALHDFTAGREFDRQNWEVYTKHDYTVFNPAHTWIEFINRLIGALTGLPVLVLFVLSVIYGVRTRKPLFPLLGAAVLFMLGFEAWLGKLVVDGNLIPGSITIHMFGAMVLVFLLLLMIRLKSENRVVIDRKPRMLIIAALIASVLQVLWGTQVREEVDYLAQSGLARTEWIGELGGMFNWHRSFSWLVLLLNAGWIYLLYKSAVKIREQQWVIGLLLLQIGGGVVLTYAGMPAALQPMHLFGGILMFAVLWNVTLRTRPLN